MFPRALPRLAAALALAATPALAADVQRAVPGAVSFWLVEDAERELGAALEAFLAELGVDPAARGWRRAGEEDDPAGILDPLARLLRLPELRGWGCERAEMELPDWPYVKEDRWEFGRQAHLTVRCGEARHLCFDLYFILGDVKGTLYGMEIKRMDEAEAAAYLRAARPIPGNCVGS